MFVQCHGEMNALQQKSLCGLFFRFLFTTLNFFVKHKTHTHTHLATCNGIFDSHQSFACPTHPCLCPTPGVSTAFCFAARVLKPLLIETYNNLSRTFVLANK